LARNFTSPVLYTVTAADSSTTKTYTVTGTVALNSAKDITGFSITAPVSATGTISGTNITLTVPYGTVRTGMSVSVTHTGAKVTDPNSTQRTANPAAFTGQNLSSSRIYTVTAADGSAKNYTVTVNVTPASSAKDIISFSVAGVNGVVGANTVTVAVPLWTSLTLSPTIVVSDGATVSPASGTAQDFSNPKTYTVRAENGSTKTYTVTVVVTTWTGANVSFSGTANYRPFNGTISGNSFSGTVNYRPFNGTISGNSFSGTANYYPFNVTISGNSFSGTVNYHPFNGTISGGSPDDVKPVTLLMIIIGSAIDDED
jgi:hypothetical protein